MLPEHIRKFKKQGPKLWDAFNKMKKKYKFKEKRNTACFTCIHVMTKSKPILFVSHDDDSSWEFTCGANGHSEEEIKIISLEEATEIDSSINELADMPEGVCAERENIGAKWIKK